MPTTRPAFFVSAAEARFLSQKLPEGREGGREGAGRPSRTAAGTDHLELGAGRGGKGRQAKRKGSTVELWPITQRVIRPWPPDKEPDFTTALIPVRRYGKDGIGTGVIEGQ